MTRIIFVRHPKAAGTADTMVTRKEDPGLDDAGQKQAEQIAQALKHEKIEAIYSSPLKRAFSAAQKIAEMHGKNVVQHPALSEIDLGEFHEKTREEWRAWLRENAKAGKYPEIPGGEDLNQKEKEMAKFVQEITAKHSGTIVVVSHATPLRLWARTQLGLERNQLHDKKMSLERASITVWDSKKKTFEKFGDTRHLQAK